MEERGKGGMMRTEKRETEGRKGRKMKKDDDEALG